jgi:regulator of sirC expression with transglutaminase-like and TPR domain
MLLLSVFPILAQSASSEPPELLTLGEFFTLPDNAIDLGKARLLIDHVIDPSLDVSATLTQLDTIAADIRAALPPGASSFDTAQYLRAYLYALGPWSAQTPFQYDLSDPFGEEFEHRLLHNYLASRKGNCITMPLLYLILGQRLGLDVSASEAPLHLFVKYFDPATGTTYNLETTDGALAVDDDYYIQKTGISERAVETGLYLQALTRKETVAFMMTLLCELYERTGEWERSMAVAQAILDQYPTCAYAMLKMGNAYAGLLNQVSDRGAHGLSASQAEHLAHLSKQNNYWFTKAEALGWREQSKAEEAAYLATVRSRQAARN